MAHDKSTVVKLDIAGVDTVNGLASRIAGAFGVDTYDYDKDNPDKNKIVFTLKIEGVKYADIEAHEVELKSEVDSLNSLLKEAVEAFRGTSE